MIIDMYLYVKLEKLDIMIRLTNQANIAQVLAELKELVVQLYLVLYQLSVLELNDWTVALTENKTSKKMKALGFVIMLWNNYKSLLIVVSL